MTVVIDAEAIRTFCMWFLFALGCVGSFKHTGFSAIVGLAAAWLSNSPGVALVALLVAGVVHTVAESLWKAWIKPANGRAPS